MKPESVGIVVGILGLIVAIVAAVIAYYAKRDTRKIADDKALNVPQLVLKYGLLSFNPENSNIQTIVYGMPQIKDGKYVGKLRILVENTGKRAAENVKLEIVVPAGANRGSEYLRYGLVKGILPGISRECFRLEKLLHVYHYLPIINPGETVSIEEPFWIEKTVDVRSSTVATTKDKKNVKFVYGFTFGFVFHLVLYHKDELPVTSGIDIYIMEENDIEAIAEQWVKIENKKDGDFPNEGSREEQTQWVMKQLDRKEFLLVIPAFDKIKVSKKKSVLFEDFDKSQRWRLVRSNQKWEAQECNWKFR